ncbi:hypothetical protein IFM89_028491 [Coptis chinensis]|uniref:Methyltransferase-like protein 17, mitochondrial n=1 Tax=Coptis chinensis TaxID=261450 RepID=A0A835HQ98_9MAGN|nr:hypothetical protein IFM89_028491 [Coptis chinensis]
MASQIPETARKIFTTETLATAAKQSVGCQVVPVRLRRAIKRFLGENETPNLKRKVLSLSQSFNKMKDANLLLTASTSRELVEDPFKAIERSKRWKIKSAYGDIGFKYRDDQTIAYVASRMPAVYSACHRVLKEVKRRLPGFAPKSVLDFGSGTGSVLWAIREVWPHSLESINLVEPSKYMQRVAQSLLHGLKDLPLIHSYDSIQALMKNLDKSDMEHDLVMASYVLGEVASLKDRITIVRQLWNLTQDVLCPHDGPCPLLNTGKYCHFVQRLQRTSSQRSETWPLDGMEFDTLKEQQAKRNPEDLEIDYEDQFESEDEAFPDEEDPIPYVSDIIVADTMNDEEDTISYDSDIVETDTMNDEEDPISYDSDIVETDTMNDEEEEEEGEPKVRANLGSGWGRILFTPVRRGRQVAMDICRSIKQDGSQGTFERVVVTRTHNPALHRQARKSLWGDLWPCKSVKPSDV